MRRKQAKAITMIQLGVAGVLLLLLVLLVYWYVEGLSAYKPKTEVHQYFGGSELNYGANDVFRDEKGLIMVTGENGKSPIVDTPLLYKGETKLTLPCNMLLMVPNESLGVKRVNYFTTVTENSGRVTFTSDKKMAQSYGGFLYDGGDLYIFLEPTTLCIGNVKEIELPPLSYAKVRYAQSVEYHNSETDEDIVIGINEVEVTAYAKSGYMLNVCKDVIYTDTSEVLLFSAVDKVAVIEMK